jgi:hypothetical protein
LINLIGLYAKIFKPFKKLISNPNSHVFLMAKGLYGTRRELSGSPSWGTPLNYEKNFSTQETQKYIDEIEVICSLYKETVEKRQVL